MARKPKPREMTAEQAINEWFARIDRLERWKKACKGCPHRRGGDVEAIGFKVEQTSEPDEFDGGRG